MLPMHCSLKGLQCEERKTASFSHWEQNMGVMNDTQNSLGKYCQREENIRVSPLEDMCILGCIQMKECEQ